MSVLTSNMYQERLYLSKGGEGDIYINNCRILWKNQIDGLRGIYRIFKKGNPGAILNDASNSGKTVLVSLFIESIQSIIDNPVLILCSDDHEIGYWKEILLNWTRYNEDDIAINSTNPYLQKKVFIQSMDLSNSFYRRCWSILILKNDEITKEISRMVFDAEFRIWITSVDVFKDLNMLSSVSKFVCPKIHINTSEFEIRNKTMNEKIKTVVLLETFTKDFVVRTDHLKSIIQKTSDANKVSNTFTVKNKDASGTKIKKSKRKINDEETRNSNNKATTKIIKTKLNDVDEQIATEQDSPSLISFISHNKSSELRNTNNIDGNVSKIPEVNYENNINSDATNVNQFNILVTDAELSKNEDSTQSLTGMSENTIDVDSETGSQIKSISIQDIEMSQKHDTKKNVLASNCLDLVVTNEIGNENKSDEVYDRETIDLNVDTSQINLNYSEDGNMELGDEMHVVNTTFERENEIEKSESINVSSISNELEMTNDKSPNSVPNIQATKNVEGNTIDKKLNDLEMKTLMKFKGSFLDSIF